MEEENIRENTENKDEGVSNAFFSEDNISYIPQNNKKKYSVEEKRWKILNYIQKNPYSNIYEIAKGMNIAYSQMHQIIRELVFCRLILSKPKQNKAKTEVLDAYYIPSKMKFCKRCGKYRGCYEFTKKYICCVCGNEILKEEASLPGNSV